MDREARTNEPINDETEFERRAGEGAPEVAEPADSAASEPGSTSGAADFAEGGDVSQLLKRLDETTAEVEEWRTRVLRAQADFDNYRKRMTREKDEVRKYASSALVEALLPVVDNMSLAIDSARQHHPEATAIVDGINMVLQQFRNVLRDNGVEEINPVGQAFDPNLHEGIATQPNEDVPEGSVALVQRIGYSLNGRLIRPAMVVVSSGPGEEAS